MTTHDLHSTTETTAPAQDAGLSGLAWLLERFVNSVPGARRVLLLSRDGLPLIDTGQNQTWADTQAAAVSGISALAASVLGPDGRRAGDPRQVVAEYDGFYLVVQSTGRSRGIFPQRENTVGTVLCVLAGREASMSRIGQEMADLVTSFAPYIEVPVREMPGADAP